MCMVICAFTNISTIACDEKKLLLKIFLSYLKLLIMNISFLSMTCITHCQICFSKGFSVAVNEIFVHMDTHLPHIVGIKMCLSMNDISVVVNTIYHKGLT
jgi:hypothetical protein